MVVHSPSLFLNQIVAQLLTLYASRVLGRLMWASILLLYCVEYSRSVFNFSKEQDQAATLFQEGLVLMLNRVEFEKVNEPSHCVNALLSLKT